MRERMPTDEFAARVAGPLKAPVELNAEFEARVMRAIAENATDDSPWWRRRRVMTVTPFRMLAAAAGLLLMLVGTAVVARTPDGGTVVGAGATDTLVLVRFVVAEPTASVVTLAGDFNGWSRQATPLAPAGTPGVWSVTIPLPAGRHEYAFVVDGTRWTTDPYALTARDEFGNESSVVRVGDWISGI